MKKRIAMLLTMLIFFASSTTCFAKTITTQGDTDTGNVYVKYVESISDVYKSATENGKARVTTTEGTIIEVSGIQNDGLRLVVLPVLSTDTEAWSWIAGSMNNYGTNICPLDIYFEDEIGNQVPINTEVAITVTLSKEYTNPVVYNLKTDGTVTALENNSPNGNTLTFKTDYSGYYVVAEKLSASSHTDTTNTTDSKDSTNPTDPTDTVNSTFITNPSDSRNNTDDDTPQTGDNSNIVLWVAVLLSSAGILCVNVKGNGKRQQKA